MDDKIGEVTDKHVVAMAHITHTNVSSEGGLEAVADRHRCSKVASCTKRPDFSRNMICICKTNEIKFNA